MAKNDEDEYGSLTARREKMMKIAAWVAISALVVTTAITFGVAALPS